MISPESHPLTDCAALGGLQSQLDHRQVLGQLHGRCPPVQTQRLRHSQPGVLRVGSGASSFRGRGAPPVLPKICSSTHSLTVSTQGDEKSAKTSKPVFASTKYQKRDDSGLDKYFIKHKVPNQEAPRYIFGSVCTVRCGHTTLEPHLQRSSMRFWFSETRFWSRRTGSTTRARSSGTWR